MTEAQIVAPLDNLLGEDGKLAVFVELVGASASTAYAEEIARAGGDQLASTRNRANDAAQQQLQRVQAQQQQFLSAAQQLGVQHEVVYRIGRALNGVSLRIAPEQIQVLRSMDSVKRVEPIYPEQINNSSSVPFMRAPTVWAGAGIARGSTGRGIKVGIIDTGIDYQHAAFGGTGLLADYQANDRSVITDQINGLPSFPTAKVVGGWDFAGDAYTGSNAPTPDPDPMDCNGHGSHVAGSAAGFGVTADGAPYAGPFDETTDFSSLRIGPGVAPEADLYALRVFGCAGSTGLTAQAIDWAMDPNNDGRFDDRLDVINMSLGSNFGDKFSATSLASDAAAKVGVVVVASAGNANDTFFISGSPGAGSWAISVASTLDPGASTAPALRVDSPESLAGFIAAGTASFGVVPPADGLSGELVLAVDGTAPTGDGCEPLTNAAELAGKIAVIDRGLCGFQVKAVNAEAAGAIAVVIANNAAGAPPGMGVTAGQPAVNIPVVSITQADADALKASLPTPGASVTMFPGTDTPSSFTSRGPRRGAPLIEVKPDVAAPGQNILSVQTGVTGPATFAADNQPLVLSGTSMAAPHIAGVMALLKDLYPGYSVEELKALVMGRALQDVTSLPNGAGLRYGPSRVGSGRSDVVTAATGQVVAFNEDDDGLVSVSFESAVRGVVSRSKQVRLVNPSATAQTFDVSLEPVVDASGVSFGVNSSQITIPANTSAFLTVSMDADSSMMKFDRDPTLSSTQAPSAASVNGNFSAAVARHYLTEESAHLVLSTGGEAVLRIPVYAAVIPESAIEAEDVIVTGANPSGSTTIALSGQGLCTGELAGSSCTFSGPTDRSSLVSPFELQISSPRDPQVGSARDIRYAGVAHNNTSGQLLFGVATWGSWSSPTDVAFQIDIDCGVYALGANFSADTCSGAPDGIFDVRVFTSNRGTLNQLFTGASTSAIDVHQVVVIGLNPARTGSALIPTNTWVNQVLPSVADTGLMANNVQIIPIARSIVKVAGAFNYRVRTCFGLSPTCSSASDTSTTAQWNHLAQGLDFSGNTLIFAQPGGAIPVTFDAANLAANGSLGALLLHHFNGEAARAEIAVIEGASVADVEVGLALDQQQVTVGSIATLTVQASNNDATNAASDAAVSLEFPDGYTLLGDNGAGTFSSSTATWTVGALAAGESRTLNILFRVDSAGPQRITARLGTSAPVDPQLENNLASVVMNALSAADLSVQISQAPASVVTDSESMRFVVSVQNNGPDQAFNLAVSEVFSSGALEPRTPLTASASVGSYDGSSGIWSIPSLSATGGQATLELDFAVPATLSTINAQFRATVTAETADTNTLNNAASHSFRVQPIRIFSDNFEG